MTTEHRYACNFKSHKTLYKFSYTKVKVIGYWFNSFNGALAPVSSSTEKQELMSILVPSTSSSDQEHKPSEKNNEKLIASPSSFSGMINE
ncbi:hypothetical protein Hanom_Chr04g00295681 [Helianthus anomalus]